MRDLKVGRDVHVGGDVHIHDHSHEPKPLALCSIDELVQERAHRQQLLDKERNVRLKLGAAAMAIGLLLLAAAGGWYYFIDRPGMGAPLLALAGLVVPLASIRLFDTPTEFEQRQLAALKEITYLLRERGR